MDDSLLCFLHYVLSLRILRAVATIRVYKRTHLMTAGQVPSRKVLAFQDLEEAQDERYQLLRKSVLLDEQFLGEQRQEDVMGAEDVLVQEAAE